MRGGRTKIIRPFNQDFSPPQPHQNQTKTKSRGSEPLTQTVTLLQTRFTTVFWLSTASQTKIPTPEATWKQNKPAHLKVDQLCRKLRG